MAKYTGEEAFKRINDDIAYRESVAVQKAEEAIAFLEQFIAEAKKGELGGYATSKVLQGGVGLLVTEAASQAGLALGYIAARNECVLAGLLQEKN